MISSLILAISLFSSARAEETVPNYTLEVMVFETFALRSWTEEYWPDEVDLPDFQRSRILQALLNGSEETPILKVESQANELTSEAARMTPQKGYRILYHQAWSMDTYDDLSMPPLLIENTERSTSASHMAGTVKLYKSRYAHVDFDLVFERRIPGRVKDEFFQHQKIGTHDFEPDFWQFKLRESRKIRPGQLHYIDHPLFGILVQLRYNGSSEPS